MKSPEIGDCGQVRSAQAFALILALIPIPAYAIEECTGGDRAARKLSCIVDGDTGWENGVKWRMLDLDAPETYGAECAQERQMGNAAKARLIELMDQGYRIEYSGEKDRTSDRRALVRVILADGRDAAVVLIEEGLAQGWPNKPPNKWCTSE